MKAAPGEVELRRIYHWRTHGSGGRRRGWPKEIGSLEDPVQRHFPLDYSKPISTGLKTRYYRLRSTARIGCATHHMIDETRLAGLLGRVVFAARVSISLAAAAVKAQG